SVNSDPCILSRPLVNNYHHSPQMEDVAVASARVIVPGSQSSGLWPHVARVARGAHYRHPSFYCRFSTDV
ncbi:MAG: hypothetical protein ACOCWQ_00165, partial [Nanoarchaeota archaeon]